MKYKINLALFVLVFIFSSSAVIITIGVGSSTSKNQIPSNIESSDRNSKSPNDWTFLVYLDADNNLEDAGIDDFLEMASVGSNPNIHIVVQFDRIPGESDLYGDWTNTKRFEIMPGMTPTDANALVDLGEVNMGLASSLSDFISWALSNYDTAHYALILWNHGSGWKADDETTDPLFKGICYDDTDGDYLDNIELKNALVTAGVYFDLIAFDACLMGMAEIDYQIKDWAQVRVGSEEVVPWDGFPYDIMLSNLVSSPTMGPVTLGFNMVTDYFTSYGTSGIESLSAIDLFQENILATEIDIFSFELSTEVATYFTEIQGSRAASEASFYDPDYIDLYDFAYEIFNRIPDPNIQIAAIDVMNTISSMVINEGHGSSHPDYYGISIYFPAAAGAYDPSYETSLDFTADLSWDEFLQDYYSTTPPDDNYEENDDPLSAYDLTLEEGNLLSNVDGLGICNDDDFYEIYVDPGDLQLHVELIFTHAMGDLDLQVLDAGYTTIAGSGSTSDNEYIDVLVTSGTYYIWVYWWSGSFPGNQYDLLWDDQPYVPPPEDNYEENDDETEAYDLSGWEQTWLSNVDGLGIQADVDWYEIYITPGYEYVQVTLTFTDADGNIDIDIVDSTLTWWTGSYSTTDNEYIDVIVPSSGIYYLVIFGDDAGNPYNLWWDDLPVVPPDDNYEPNDDPGEAYDLTIYEDWWLSDVDGLGIQADDDWYEIYIDPGDQHVLVTCTFTHVDGDIGIAIVDFTLSWGIGNDSATDNEYLDVIVPSSGIYYLFIFGDEAGNSYNLWWDDTPGVPPPDDNYEENDDYTSAYDLSSYEQTWLSTIDGPGYQHDDDWYEIYITPGFEHLQVTLTFSDAAGDIDIEVYNATLDLIAGSWSVSDNEYIDVIVPSAGTYYLKIFLADAGNPYDLWWDDLAYSIPAEDNYEENDAYTSAYDLSANGNTWLSTINGPGIQADDDWYKIYITPSYENLVVDCTFSHMEGNIDLGIYDSSGTLTTESRSSTDNEHVDIVLPSPGIYYIKVNGSNIGNVYDLRWNTIIIDDNYEENDDYSTAYDLSAHENEWLHTIDGYGIQVDEDWYEISITDGYEDLNITLLFLDSMGNIDLALYDSSGNLIISSTTTSDHELIEYTVDSGGTYYIRVYGDNSGNSYTLIWITSKTPGGGGEIPGYNLLFLLGVIIIITALSMRKLIKRKPLH